MTDRRVKEYIIGKDAVAEFVKTVQEWEYQKDWQKKNCIFNPETGISEDGTIHDCVYRPWINQPKKEQKMTREEALRIIAKHNDWDKGSYVIKANDDRHVIINHWSEELNQAFRTLVEPPTLADFLGWEEGQEYEWRGDIVMLENGKIYYKSDKCSSGWCNYAISGNEIEDLRQAKKVEKPKLKAWHVKDEYSLECLVQELQDQGFEYKNMTLKEHMEMKKDSLKRDGGTYLYIDEYTGIDGFDKGCSLINKFEIIEYHKEQPRYLLQTDLTSENSI